MIDTILRLQNGKLLHGYDNWGPPLSDRKESLLSRGEEAKQIRSVAWVRPEKKGTDSRAAGWGDEDMFNMVTLYIEEIQPTMQWRHVW